LAVNCVAVYLYKTIWPVNLAPYYPLSPGGLPAAQFAAAVALIIFITLGALAVGRRHPYVTVGWLWYLITLIPTTGVVQLGNYSYADRYTYVPSIGIYLAAVWWAAEVISRSGREGLVRATSAIVVVTLAFLSWRQAPIWHDSIALWEHAKRVTPDNYFMRTHLGLSYQRAGRLKEAELELAAAVELRPDMALVRDNLGLLLLATGRPVEAEARFREAMARDPRAARYRLHLVEALKHQGRLQAAEEEFRALTETSPGG
jgi:tetratricopeptide (TPR) repeat protein